jgi:hypothetical protein
MTNKSSDNKDDSDNYSEKLRSKEDLNKLPLYYVKPEKKKPIVEKVEFDKKKKKRWIPILALFVIAAGSTPLILNTCKDDQSSKKKISSQTVSDNTENGSKSSEIIEETLIEEFHDDTMFVEELENEIIEVDNTIELENTDKNFHIIVGSFENEENANSLIQELQQYHQIMQVIKYKGMYRVAFSSLSDRDQAEIQLDYIKNTLRKTAWIAYMK